jgi:hypothetical protein
LIFIKLGHIKEIKKVNKNKITSSALRMNGVMDFSSGGIVRGIFWEKKLKTAATMCAASGFGGEVNGSNSNTNKDLSLDHT